MLDERCPSVASQARVIVLGSAGLTEGFGLIGAEVYPDATAATVEAVLQDLAHAKAAALVLLEAYLAHGEGEWLTRIRSEGGSIVVTELPPLYAPEAYTPAVDAVVAAVLGAEALNAATSDE